MEENQKEDLSVFVKTALVALCIIVLLLSLMLSNRHVPKPADNSAREASQKITLLEKRLADEHELLQAAKETNASLRETVSELRGIHNDCQRNATDNFLREHRNQTAR